MLTAAAGPVPNSLGRIWFSEASAQGTVKVLVRLAVIPLLSVTARVHVRVVDVVNVLQKRDAVRLMSAADHAFEKRWSTAAASADFPCARNAAARPNSDHPFSGNRSRSSR